MNAKSVPADGRIYGDNIASMLEDTELYTDEIPLDGSIELIDPRHISIMWIRGRRPMGISVPGKTVDADKLKAMKIRRDEDFKVGVSRDGVWYVLDNGKTRYALGMYDDTRTPPKIPKIDEGHPVEIDTRILAQAIAEAKPILKKDGNCTIRITISKNDVIATVHIFDDDYGTYVLGKGDPSYRRPVQSSFNPLYIANIPDLADTVRINMLKDDYPLAVEWDDPMFKGHALYAPVITNY